MKRPICIILLSLCMSPYSRAEQLIVRKDSVTIMASSATREGESILYTDARSGKEGSIPVAELDGIVAKVERGRDYTTEEINKALRKIKYLKARHGMLRRQFTQLLQEWEALKNPAQDYSREISALVEEFTSGPKTTAAYKKASMDLGMIVYKDLSGKNKDRTDAALKEIRGDYVATNMARFERQMLARDLTIQDFIEAQEFAEAVSKAVGATEKGPVERILENIRDKVCESHCRRVKSIVAEGGGDLSSLREAFTILGDLTNHVATTASLRAKVREADSGVRAQAMDSYATRAAETFDAGLPSLDTYLRSMVYVNVLRYDVANSDALRLKVESDLAGFRAKVKEALPQYSFVYRGFPLSGEDIDEFTMRQKLSSVVDASWMSAREECLLIALEDPGILSVGGSYSVPLRLVFNQEQPPMRRYGIGFSVFGANGVTSSVQPLPRLPISDARLDFRLKGNLAFEDPGFEVSPDKSGRKNVFVYLACMDNTGDARRNRWVPISLACRWPVE